ncbi:MAG: hypothetical protein K0R17_3557 [Rariglobus sp.]|jgi:hypothetical protein|nr:hypothetical protein [Rariglobus sp.]
MSTTLKEQITVAVGSYAEAESRRFKQGSRHQAKASIQAAVLSGIGLAAHHLVATDGSETITPLAMEKAVAEVAVEMGFKPASLKNTV